MIWPLTTSLLLTSLLLVNSAPVQALVVPAIHHKDSLHWMSSVCLILFPQWPIPLLPWALFLSFKKKKNNNAFKNFTGKDSQSTILYISRIPIKFEGRNDIWRHAKSQQISLPFLSQEAPRGCAPPTWHNNPRKRKWHPTLRQAPGIPRVMVMGSSVH